MTGTQITATSAQQPRGPTTTKSEQTFPEPLAAQRIRLTRRPLGIHFGHTHIHHTPDNASFFHLSPAPLHTRRTLSYLAYPIAARNWLDGLASVPRTISAWPSSSSFSSPVVVRLNITAPLKRVRHDIYCKLIRSFFCLHLLHIACVSLSSGFPAIPTSIPLSCMLHAIHLSPCNMYMYTCVTQFIPQSCTYPSFHRHSPRLAPYDTRFEAQRKAGCWHWPGFPLSRHFLFSPDLSLLLPIICFSLHWLPPSLPLFPFHFEIPEFPGFILAAGRLCVQSRASTICHHDHFSLPERRETPRHVCYMSL